MMAEDLDYAAYEGSDESSESELLDQSLSVWKGVSVRDEHFLPIPLDLHTAASIGQYDSVRAIIDRGEVSLNQKNAGGWTALMYAAYIGHDNILNLLLDAVVEVNVSDNKGRTPLMLAASCGNESVAYFLLQAGAELEARDKAGWTALFHATYSGHQDLVKFLLEHGATTDNVEPVHGYTPLMEAASAGHEIIVQSFLQHGINMDLTCSSGNTALSIALMNGHTKIVSLIRNHTNGPSLSMQLHGSRATGDFSSSDEAIPGAFKALNSKSSRCRTRTTGPNIQEGPEALARIMSKNKEAQHAQHTSVTIAGSYVPRGFVTFEDCDSRDEPDAIRFRDVTSPISADDYTAAESLDQQDDCDKTIDAFSKTGALTIKSSSESSGGLIRALGLSQESSDEADDLDYPRTLTSEPCTVQQQQQQQNSVRCQPRVQDSRKNRDASTTCNISDHSEQATALNYAEDVHANDNSSESENEVRRPHDLKALLQQHGLIKYLTVFDEQDVDLQVFLSLTDNDLKEVGIKLFGPRRKMTNAIARWHSKAHLSTGGELEKAYADKLEAEMQEMAIQLHKAYEQGEYLKRHALQESKLRSVAETLLMEDRAAWQHVCRLSTQVRNQCSHLQAALESLRPYEEEMARRLGCELSLSSAVKPDRVNMSSIDNQPDGRDSHQGMSVLNIDQMADAILECHKDLSWMLSENIASAEQLLESAEQAGAMNSGVS